MNYSKMLKSFILSSSISNIIALTTLVLILDFFVSKEAFYISIFIYPFWFIVETYFQTFHQFERRDMPTPKFYNSGIPMILSSIFSWSIIGISAYFIFFK